MQVNAGGCIHLSAQTPILAVNMSKNTMDTMFRLLGFIGFKQLVQECFPAPEPFLLHYASES